MSGKNRSKDINFVKEIHTEIKKSSLILRQRMVDLREELAYWQEGVQHDDRNGELH